jgi:hypothetical protein
MRGFCFAPAPSPPNLARLAHGYRLQQPFCCDCLACADYQATVETMDLEMDLE